MHRHAGEAGIDAGGRMVGDGGTSMLQPQQLQTPQHQIAALLTAALPASQQDTVGLGGVPDDATRAASLEALHHLLLQPHVVPLVRRSLLRLCQSLHQLLGDKAFVVRQAAAVTYGALGALAAALPSSGSGTGRPNATGAGVPAERFLGWALPQLADRELDGDAAVVALAGLQEFLSAGDASATERYAPSVFKACQAVLEDEGTSMTLVRPMLGLLAVLSLRFSRCFQPQFADTIDLLLGWALEPDFSESDRQLITEAFLRFQRLWAENLRFSLGLLSKFLDDIEMLAQDVAPASTYQLRRLLALVSCFLAVLRATVSGIVEIGPVEQVTEPSKEMLPRFLACVAVAGRKYGDYKWISEVSKCLTTFAELLKADFSPFYDMALEILLQGFAGSSDRGSMQRGCIAGLATAPTRAFLTANQVHSLLQVNMELMVQQGVALPAPAVTKLVGLGSSFSQLRLHPNRLVTGTVSATYLFLLRHTSPTVVAEAGRCLVEEMISLKAALGHSPDIQVTADDAESSTKSDGNSNVMADVEVVALFKFDLMALVGSMCLGLEAKKKLQGLDRDEGSSGLGAVDPMEMQISLLKKLKGLLLDKLNPFKNPLQCYPDLQLALFRALHRLSRVQLWNQETKCANGASNNSESRVHVGNNTSRLLADTPCWFANGHVIAQGLSSYASVPVKLEALNWISSLCEVSMSLECAGQGSVSGMKPGDGRRLGCRRNSFGRGETMPLNLLWMLLSAASDKELKVRDRVAVVLEMLLQAELIDPSHMEAIAVVSLEQLGDSEPAMQNAFRRVLLAFAPAALWMRGWMSMGDLGVGHRVVVDDRNPRHWKTLFAAKPSAQHLRPQQLVCVVNFIAQRWQVLPSHWLQRLVHSAPSYFRSSNTVSAKLVGEGDDATAVDNTSLVVAPGSRDYEFLEKACSSNNLAAYWWCIQEAARHCVTVRLRTHLGGPTQTFAALERMLLEVAQHLQTDSGQREGLGSTSTVHLLPMRLLLEFVEALKKNVYNAFDGCVVLPAAAPSSALFFRANKKVCEEWFSRIREALMNASVAVQSFASTVHQATWRLQDLRAMVASVLREQAPRSQLSENVANMKFKLQQDVGSVLRHASLALCRAHDADALVGLQTWASSSFGSLLIEDGSVLQRTACSPMSQFGWMQGLAFQARGQYEKAAAHFAHLLQSEEAMGAMGADGVQFTIARAIESFVAINDWESLDSWVQTLHMLRAKHAGKAYSGALTTAGNDMNAIHALARFDIGDIQGAWGYLDLTPQSSNELTADPRLALQRSEQMLLQAMMRPDSKKDEALKEITTGKIMLEEALLVAGLDGLFEASPFVMQLDCIRTFEGGMKCDKPPEGSLVKNSFLSALPQVITSPFETLHQDCSLWLKLLRVHRAAYPGSQITFRLQQQLVKLARKQQNFRLAHRLLPDSGMKELFEVEVASATRWQALKLSFDYESILLDYSEAKHEEAVDRLWNFVQADVARCLSSSSDEVVAVDVSSIKAKACLKLSRWLKQKNVHSSLSGLLLKMGTSGNATLREGHLNCDRGELMSYPPGPEEIVGAATKVATLICPGMANAWFSYACWCYEHAKGCFSGSSLISRASAFSELLQLDVNGIECSLTEVEVGKLRSIITAAVAGYPPQDTTTESEQFSQLSDDNLNMIDSLVQRILHIMQAVAGAAGVEDSDGDSPATLLSLQLQQELKMLHLNASHCMAVITQLMTLWWALRRRRVVLFGHAARGFLHYLSMSHDQQQRKVQSSWLSQGKGGRKDTTLLASLYVFRILLNYGVELEASLQQGLSTVPPSPWQAITAQLFARLSSHPEPKVRKQLQGLLMALANVSPWAIVYPTLVDFNACEGNPSEELQNLLGCLRNLHSKLVHDVQVMIAELGSITVLWEEQWLSTLQDLHSDVSRRINTLKEEAARVAENPTLSHGEKVRINAAKYSAMMAPIAVALDRRLASTSRPPVTPHETWFQEQFGSQLKAAISMFKSPPAGSGSLVDSWRPLDAIAASLANHQKKSLTVIADVSPQLAALKSSEAPMPGLEVDAILSNYSTDNGRGVGVNALPEIVTVAAFDEQVFILSTKTKPKKLALVGSDGQRYTYLLKGREDLRLDARIMQLLHAVNGMLNARSHTRRQGLAVRHYSVTPISGRAGLIQWIDNLTSMYSVFRAWQQRTQAAQLATSAGGTNSSFVPPAVPRPSDMFYGKIIPALKEKGLRKVISRRDWPQEVKRKVLLELMKETPRQLLYKELWCSSEGITAFSSKLQRFSGSVAVMSMVGHILGLGDRHLDNILVDFNTGDVVHIDYNVCFDKGLRLKIPEIVPFRLTQTIQAALGLTGVEGSFRASCEAVLEALQKNKELILMLLEVFVWDPLVEWMRGDGHDEATIGGEERKGMELAVSLSLFASRVQEIRVPLQEHHDQLLATLPAATDNLRNLLEALDRIERATMAASQAEIKKSAAGKSERASRSLMNDASTALEKARLSFESQARDFAQAKALVSEAAREFTQWIEHHGRVLESLRSGTAPEVSAIGQLPSPVEALSLTSAVLAAGVPLTIVPEPAQVHCKEVDREVVQLTITRHEALLHAARTLRAYSLALQRLLPPNYIATSHVHMWAQVLQLSVRQLSPDVLAAAKRQSAELVARSSGDHDEAARQKYETIRMHVDKLVKDSNKLQEDHAILEGSIDPEAEKKAKDRLLGIFTRHLQVGGQLVKKEEDSMAAASGSQSNFDESKEKETETEEKRMKLMAVLQAASSTMYGVIGERVSDLCSGTAVDLAGGEEKGEDRIWCLPELLGLTERCVLVSEIMTEIHQSITQGSGNRSQAWWDPATSSFGEWALSCKLCIVGVQDLVNQMVAVVLPEAIKAALSHDPAVMEAFAALSQIRGTVDTAIEQVTEIEMQRSSLKELERSYPDKFGEISQRLSSLEAAALSGRDHLSWEEAEELANQEEACREMQDQLNRAWTQRGAQASALSRKEGNIRATLLSAEHRFESLVSIDRDTDLHLMRGKVLLAAFAKLFSGLEILDQKLDNYRNESSSADDITYHGQADFMSGGSTLESVWKASNVLKDKTFFVWKVGMMDALLDACIRDALSTIDASMALEQVLGQQKKRLDVQLQRFLDQYLKERVAVVLLDCLVKQKHLMTLSISSGDDEVHVARKDGEPVKRALRLLREYCDVHETVRGAKAAAGAMKCQLEDLNQALQSAYLEAAQLEWLHEASLSRVHPQSQLVGMPKSFAGDSSTISWWDRQQMLESFRSAIAGISRATDGLMACDIPGTSAEEQLDRAMAWACAGSSTPTSAGSSAARNVGIPPEFHEHLRRRRQLLWSGQEQASGIVRLCEAVMNFEASREGYLSTTSASTGTVKERRDWQKTYQNLILRLESVCLAFSRCDLECQAAQKNIEVASARLTSAAEEYSVAAKEAEVAAMELEGASDELRDRIVSGGASVSAFCRVLRNHSALTVESGSMLEEVLAITDGTAGASDVHSLAQEAAAEHSKMMSDLNRVSGMLLPLEPVLLACCTTISDQARGGELEKKADGSSLAASLQSLHLREALPSLMGALPGFLGTVKLLHSTMTRLARTASSDAGLLHKALEGVGESQEARSQDVQVAAGLAEQEVEFPDDDRQSEPLTELGAMNPDMALRDDLLLDDDEDSWISPPDSSGGQTGESGCLSGDIGQTSSASQKFSADIGRNTKVIGGHLPSATVGSSAVDGQTGESVYLSGDIGQTSQKFSADSARNARRHIPSATAANSAMDGQTDMSGDIGQPSTASQKFSADSSRNTRVLGGLLPSASAASSAVDHKQPVGEGRGGIHLKQQVSSKMKSSSATYNSYSLPSLPSPQHSREKNAYAVSVLARVRTKLEGRDIDGSRHLSIAEQVDHLLRQATSIDNLCNMYEGWTPWI